MLDPIGAWSLARALKFFGLACFLLGLAGSIVPGARELRLRATYSLLVPGFVGTYMGGWLLMKLSGRDLLTPWLLAGAIAGLGALHVGFLASHRPLPRPATPVITWACAGAAIAWMVLRIEGPWFAPVGVAGAILGGIAARPFSRTTPACGPTDADHALRGLRWLTRLETSSLLLLLVAMPLRRSFGIHVDGGTGLLGWTHGVLVVLFLQSLWSTRTLAGLPSSVLGLGALSALVPGGGFWFERRWLVDAPGFSRAPSGETSP